MFKVLVVDDDRSIRRLLQEALAVEYEVVTASTCEDAIDILEDGDIDLLFLDVWMYGIESCWVTLWIKERKLRCKVIFVTGDDQAKQNLADGILYKPFNIADALNIAAVTLQSLGKKLK